MENRMYEIRCDDGFMVRSPNMDDVLQSAKDHIKRVHNQDQSTEQVRKLVREIAQPIATGYGS